MQRASWFLDLDQLHSSYLLLGTLALFGFLVGVLYQIGFIGWLMRIIGRFVRSGIRNGFFIANAARLGILADFLVLVFVFVVLGLARSTVRSYRPVCFVRLFMGVRIIPYVSTSATGRAAAKALKYLSVRAPRS